MVNNFPSEFVTSLKKRLYRLWNVPIIRLGDNCIGQTLYN